MINVLGISMLATLLASTIVLKKNFPTTQEVNRINGYRGYIIKYFITTYIHSGHGHNLFKTV